MSESKQEIQRTLKCNKCEKAFGNYRALNGHKGACGRIRPAKANKKKYPKWKNQDGHICIFCNREFETGPAHGWHLVNCKLNPKRKKYTNWVGRKHKEETKQKMRLAQIEHIERRAGKQMIPSYNPASISVIEEFGRCNGFVFQHAERGGEFYIEQLGFWVDAYDPIENVVVEYDEYHHFDKDGKLKQKDVNRQNMIENFLNCRFFRIKADK